MHTLFNTSTSASLGVIKFPEWLGVRENLLRNLSSVVNYYQRRPMAVASEHFLVRLLASITVPQSQDLYRYYDNVDAMALNLSMALGMTSSISKGELFKGVFYHATPEVLIASSANFDFEVVHRQWERVQAVRVLRHPRTDLGFALPTGNNPSTESGLAVVMVNIPMLAVQYRAFRLNEERLTGAIDSQRSIMQFIHLHVLPNMLYTQTDVAVFNRIDRLSQGGSLASSTQREHSFYVPEQVVGRCTDVQSRVLGLLQDNPRDFLVTLATVPMVVRPSLLEASRLPAVASTRQVEWALTTSRLDMLGFLVRTAPREGRNRNQREVNAILRSAIAYRNDNVLRTVLPASAYELVQEQVNAIVHQALL